MLTRNGRILAALLAANLLGLAGLALYGGRPGSASVETPVSYGAMLAMARAGKLRAVTVSGNRARFEDANGALRVAALPEDAHPSDQLVAMGVDVTAAARPGPGLLPAVLGWLLPLCMLGLMAWMAFGTGAKGAPGTLAFGRSKARRHAPDATGKVTFDDVAGVEHAKDDLLEIVDFLADSAKFRRIGARIPRGVLLVGPPGTGKTLLARAVAGEANVPFYSVSGSDFVEMFVGVGASRVRDTFETARRNAPCIVFIDEVDALGRSRGGAAFGNDEREQTLNQMLVEMDGFGAGSEVVVLAATNRPDVLDAALLRPGRFDRQVMVPNPDLRGREAILRVHMRKVSLDRSADAQAIARTLARGTPGFSGADLANLVNEAALAAARRNARAVTEDDFERARDRQLLGAERRSLAVCEDERRMTAYHEAGHAVCAVLEPESDPVHKATIVPRGRALGFVMRIPEDERHSTTRAKIEADLTVAMAGREAERHVFGDRHLTNGAQGDIATATAVARRMVTEWGFSEKLGAVRYPGHDDASPFRQREASEATAALIDEEVRRIIQDASGRARAHLASHTTVLRLVAEALLERETLTGAEVRAIVSGEDTAGAARQA
jgi:cell division protease FtsH